MSWIVVGPGSDGGFYAVRQRNAAYRIGPHQSADEAQKTVDHENARERIRDAAPSLLAACKAALDEESFLSNGLADDIRAAIAKAEGTAP